jgi:hypothetical protein
MADTNYFRKTASDLFPGKTYYFQFRWKYADGTYSAWSATKTQVAPGTLQVEAPTLATGLTAATASFGVTVSWDGTYSSSTFLGFKSINIYASTSNLGSSTTTDISASLVGSMTVDQVKNQITIGSTLLKNTLSLTSTSVYTTPIFFYYITINENNEVYKSGGVATYTRINSSGITPTQANFVDIANGVISIEKLVAGNGQFTEYLRAGIRAGDGSGARIEISGSSSNITSTNGGTVLPGLTIYNSAGGQSLRAPLSGGLTITGTITGSDIIQSSNTSSNRIEMLASDPGKISFYANNSTYNLPGFLDMDISGFAGFQLKAPGNSSWSGDRPYILAWQSPVVGNIGTVVIAASNTSNSQIQLRAGYSVDSIEAGGVVILTNTNATASAVRNIMGTTDTSTPTGGLIGDIVVSYTA